MSTRGKDFHDEKAAAVAQFQALRERLIELQKRLYAEQKRKLLVILQAMDAGGKDGAINDVFRGVNVQGVDVTSFKVPTAEELAHDFLWRIHRAVPGSGMIGVFNRSQYGDVVVVRVDQLVPDSVWRARYEQINQFEKLLVETGTTILKFFLHISKKEQQKRFQERIDDPTKRWKFSRKDLRIRGQWDDYMAAYEDMLNRCTTEWAPWYVIPADQNWYRNLAIAKVIVDTLDRMDPRFPEPLDDISEIVIE
jgi:PPK2 family polyphosphate:nucleotide phosphotransferase